LVVQLLGESLFELLIAHCVELVLAGLEVVFELVNFPERELIPGCLDHASEQRPRAKQLLNSCQKFVLIAFGLHFY